MNRAKEIGLVGHMITGGTLSDSQDALNIANERDDCYSTCGVHPTRCNEFESADDSEAYLEGLKKLIMENKQKILAVGECGIDYERVEQTWTEVFVASHSVQLIMFEPEIRSSPFLSERSSDEMV